MSHFNKNLSPLLLLALFINVTTFSMNAKAATIDIYNYVAKPSVKINCGTDEGQLYPYVLPYNDKYEIPVDSLRVACDFKWNGGALSYQMMYDPTHDTCTTCVWHLNPKPKGLCFQKPGGGEACVKYDG